MACGLANRMFQYSYYLFLKKQGYEVTVDFYRSAKLAHEKVVWGIERSGFFNGREKWAKGFENQRV